MSDRGSSFQDDSLDFDPALGWNLRPESFAESDKSRSSLSKSSGSHPESSDLLRLSGEPRGDLDYSMHLRPSDGPFPEPGAPEVPHRPSASARPPGGGRFSPARAGAGLWRACGNGLAGLW